MNAQYIQDKLDTLQEEKKDLQSQLQHAFSDATIEKLEEQIKELDHSINIVRGWQPNEWNNRYSKVSKN